MLRPLNLLDLADTTTADADPAAADDGDDSEVMIDVGLFDADDDALAAARMLSVDDC